MDRFRTLLADFRARKLPAAGLDAPQRSAAHGDQAEILGLLLDAGANPNDADENHGTALARVAGGDDENHLLMARRLFAAGALPHGPGSRETAFHTALEYGSREMVETFIAAGADPNLDRPDTAKPIEFAVRSGTIGSVQALIDAGARLTVKKGESPPLYLAVERGFAPLVECLLKGGADVNGRGQGGQLPLHLAFATGRFDLCSLLVRSGARRDLPDENGVDFTAVFDERGNGAGMTRHSSLKSPVWHPNSCA